MQRNVCDWGLPDFSSWQDYPRHPCLPQALSVSCSLFTGAAVPTVFDTLSGSDNLGISLIGGASGGNSPNSCDRYIEGASVSCSRSGDHWCCTCRVDHRTVRALSVVSETCPGEDLPRTAEACGWRW